MQERKGEFLEMDTTGTVGDSMVDIEAFEGNYRFLSNFHPCTIKYEGITYPSVEHAYQACKSTDYEVRREIALLPTPGKARRLGSALQLRPQWDGIKLGIMADLLRLKFEDPVLRSALISTKGTLTEGNSWGDTFWGVYNGVGENNLGKLLMTIREELR
jgi:ribA/ribD-fused uncharacterized protein